MTSPMSHSQDVQSAVQGEEFIDGDLDSQTLGNARPRNPPPHPPGGPPASKVRRTQAQPTVRGVPPIWHDEARGRWDTVPGSP